MKIYKIIPVRDNYGVTVGLRLKKWYSVWLWVKAFCRCFIKFMKGELK